MSFSEGNVNTITSDQSLHAGDVKHRETDRINLSQLTSQHRLMLQRIFSSYINSHIYTKNRICFLGLEDNGSYVKCVFRDCISVYSLLVEFILFAKNMHLIFKVHNTNYLITTINHRLKKLSKYGYISCLKRFITYIKLMRDYKWIRD